MQLDVLAGREVDPVPRMTPRHADQSPSLVGLQQSTGDAYPDHEDVVLELRAHTVRLQRVSLFRRQVGVADTGEPLEVDRQARSLRAGDVRSCHERTVRTACILRVSGR